MRRPDLPNGDRRDSHCREEEHERDDSGGDRLCLAVPVRMVLIRRPRGDAQTHPDYEGRENVGGRLDRVGNERVGVADDSRDEFDKHEHRVRQQAGLRPADAPPRRAFHSYSCVLEISFLQTLRCGIDAGRVGLRILSRHALRNDEIGVFGRM